MSKNKERVMDDLDALLVALESTASVQKGQQLHQDNSSREATPPPLPPYPQDNMFNSGPGRLNYEPPTVRRQTTETHSSAVITSSASPNYASVNYPGVDPRSSLRNNLSELDVLLQDLSSAQFKAELDRRTRDDEVRAEVITPVRMTPARSDRNVDHMLEQLDREDSPLANHYEAVQIKPNVRTGAPTASATTRDLDDLLASLSEFKLNKQSSPEASFNGRPAHVGEPPYAVANKRFQPEQLPQVQNAHMQGPSGDRNLDDMLGSLSSDLSQQGVSTVSKGVCAACNKPVIGQVITALGQLWHPEHFVCSHCKVELGTRNFFERDGIPLCEQDYHVLCSPRCALCEGPIIDKCVTALDRTWHPEHFVCAQCHRPFGDDGFHEKDGFAYCKADYFDMFAPKCGNCGRAIMDNYITAIGKQFHPKCFVCKECNQPFGNASFYEFDGAPFCESHYHAKRGSLCAACKEPITGRCITAMYKKFHPEHFVCAFCLKQLNKGTFKEQNDKPYCHQCFVKLFG